MLLHKGLTHVHSQKKPVFHFKGHKVGHKSDNHMVMVNTDAMCSQKIYCD